MAPPDASSAPADDMMTSPDSGGAAASALSRAVLDYAANNGRFSLITHTKGFN